MLRPNIGHSADDAERFYASVTTTTSGIQYEPADTRVWGGGDVAALPEIIRVGSATELINSLPSTPKLYPTKLGSSIPWDTRVLVNEDWNEYLEGRDTISNDDILREREQYYKENPDNVGKNRVKEAVIRLNNTTKAELMENIAAASSSTNIDSKHEPQPSSSNTSSEPKVDDKVSSESKVNASESDRKKEYYKDIENRRTKLKDELAKLDKLTDVVNLNDDAPLADGSKKTSSSPIMDAINKHRADSKTKQ